MSFWQLPGWLVGLVACMVGMVVLATGWLASAAQGTQAGTADRRWWWATVLGVPLLSVLLYARLGHPVAANPVLSMADNAAETMVDKLATRLKSSPGDQSAWLMLARSYRVLGKLEEADQTYRHAQVLGALPIDELTDWIQVRIDLASGAFDEQTRLLLAEAVKLMPDHDSVLLFQGLLAIDQGNYPQATQHLQVLLSHYEAGSVDHEALTQVLALLKAGKDPRRKTQGSAADTPGR